MIRIAEQEQEKSRSQQQDECKKPGRLKRLGFSRLAFFDCPLQSRKRSNQGGRPKVHCGAAGRLAQ